MSFVLIRKNISNENIKLYDSEISTDDILIESPEIITHENKSKEHVKSKHHGSRKENVNTKSKHHRSGSGSGSGSGSTKSKHRKSKSDLIIEEELPNDDEMESDMSLEEINRQIELCTDELDEVDCKSVLIKTKRIKLLQMKLDDMKKQKDKILKNMKKIPDDEFKQKIDLTGKCETVDVTLSCMINGKECYKDNAGYKPVPKHLESLDKFKNKKSLFGNKPLPKNLINLIK